MVTRHRGSRAGQLNPERPRCIQVHRLRYHDAPGSSEAGVDHHGHSGCDGNGQYDDANNNHTDADDHDSQHHGEHGYGGSCDDFRGRF